MPNVDTQLGSVGVTSAAVRDDAAAYLRRTGNADLIEVLGLADPVRKQEPGFCARGHALPSHGMCRRSMHCRAETERLIAEREACDE